MSTDYFLGVEVPHNVSIKLLSQFSGAVADPYANHVASIMFKDLVLGPQGERRVNSALTSLPIYFTADERLTFGWSFDNIIRNNDVHQEGYEHLAIMVALAESFHSGWAAEICHEMASSIAGPKDSLPHLGQWQAILRSCSGAFAGIGFGVILEDFLRLNPYNLDFGIDNQKYFPVSAREIVAALHALAAVVKGTQTELTLTGSHMLAWFAAVAEVLYDLPVAVFSEDGKSLSHTKAGEEPRVRIIYREKPGIEILSSIEPQGLTHTMSKLGITSQQYATSIHSIPLSGRVVWQSLLPRVFGASFGHLDHEHSRTFSEMIGVVARMFEGLSLDQIAAEGSISAQRKSSPSSYGAGLLSTLSSWLPELRRYQGRMERALKLDQHTAAEAYDENITKLCEACHCGVCSSKPGDENEGRGPSDGYCLVVLVESVIAIGLALSKVMVASQIFPTRAGVQRIYKAQVQKRMEARVMTGQDHFRALYGDEWNAPTNRRLQSCCALFSGSLPTRNLPENLVALAHEGIVAYLLKMEKGHLEEEDEAIIRVSSGSINVRQKLFRRACMGPIANRSVGDLWEAVYIEHLDVPLYCK